MSDDSDNNDRMTLKTDVSKTQGASHQAPPSTQPPREDCVPMMGLFAVGFSVLGIFTMAPIFAPFGLILGIVAVFMGQIALGITAILLAVVAVLTSPSIMALVGLGAFLAWLGL